MMPWYATADDRMHPNSFARLQVKAMLDLAEPSLLNVNLRTKN